MAVLAWPSAQLRPLLQAVLLLWGLPLLLPRGGGFSPDPTEDLDQYGIFMPFLYFNCSADYQRVVKAASKIPIWMSVCCDHTDPSASGPAWPGSPWPVDGQPGSGLLNPNPCHLKNKMGRDINRALDDLRAAGVKITHYVHTRVTNYPNGSYAPCCQCCETLANITERIETEIAAYPSDGIFIDNLRAGKVPAPYSFFREVYERTQARGGRLVVSNPGGYLFPEEFMNISDIVCSFESPGHVFNESDGGCGHVRRPGRQYPDCDRDFNFTPWRHKMSMLAYPTPADQWRPLLHLAARRDYTKFWFNDHDTGDTIPPYFEEMVDEIAQLNLHPPPPPHPAPSPHPSPPSPPSPPTPPPPSKPAGPFQPWTKTLPLDPTAKLPGCPMGSKHGYVFGGSATIEVPPDGLIHFLQFASNSFAPDEWDLQSAVDGASWQTVASSGLSTGASTASVTVHTLHTNSLYPLTVSLWNVTGGSRLRAYKCWRDPNRHLFFSKLIVVNDSSVLPRLRTLLPKSTGEALSALPAAVRNTTWTEAEIWSQFNQLTDPVLTNLGTGELSSRDPRIERAALPMDHMRIPLATRGEETAAPAMAFQSGTWMTSQNADAYHQANHGPPPAGKIDLWVVPALLQACGGSQECTVVPAPLSAKTGWKHVEDTALPVFTLQWESNETSVTQSLYSMKLATNASNCSCDPKGTCRGLCHSAVVSHFVLGDRQPGFRSSESLLFGIGRQPGMRDCTVEAERMKPDPAPQNPSTLYAFDCIWAAGRTWNKYKALNTSTGAIVQAFNSDGTCSVAIVSSAPLRIHSVGVTETRVQIASGEREVFVATPQRETACDSIEMALSLAEFQEREIANEAEWREWLRSAATFDLPSVYWSDHISIWLQQVATLGILGSGRSAELSYGTCSTQY